MKSRYRKLDLIYKKIPEIECKGLCHPTCAMIPAAGIEIKRARDRLKINPFQPNSEQRVRMEKEKVIPFCRALTNERCTIHDIRPGICRLYGAAEELICQYGCQSKKILLKEEAYAIIREIEAL